MFIPALFLIVKQLKQLKCPSTNEQINECDIAIPQTILTVKRNTDKCYNMEEPGKHHDTFKKPVNKNNILYDSAHTKGPDQAKRQKQQLLMARCVLGETGGNGFTG